MGKKSVCENLKQKIRELENGCIGNHITIYTGPGHGKSFHVYLPFSHFYERAEENLASEPVPKGQEHIVLVGPLGILRASLESLGYQVTTISSGAEALHFFHTEPQKAQGVIADMIMPDITGLELSRELMLICPDVSIILCIGFRPETERCSEYGLPPEQIRNLARTLRDVLDQN